MYSLSEAQDYLEVSSQTIKNWIRNKKVVFNSDGFISQEELNRARHTYLQKRANRRGSSKVSRLAGKLLSNNSIPDILFSRITDLSKDIDNASLKLLLLKYKSRWNCSYVSNIPDIEPGILYQQLLSVQNKSRKGIHYTPECVAADVLSATGLIKGRVLDPCCGDGFFLRIIARERKSFVDIYGCDSDPHAVFLCSVNLILETGEDQLPYIYECDFLSVNLLPVFSLIITNPPWGRIRLNNKNHEMFDRIIRNSLNASSRHIYLLPHSAAHVHMHSNFRKHVEKQFSVNILAFDIPFKQVQSKGFLVEFSKINSTVNSINSTWILNKHPFADSILKKMFLQNPVFLKNKGEWFLGIVSGDNEKYISSVRTNRSVRVIRGQHVFHDRIDNSLKEYIDLNDFDEFQQKRPIGLYRQAKIVYRFIANRPVCFYDIEGVITLNSANCFMPGDFVFNPEEIVAILNSDLIAFYLHYTRQPLKILKSHLQAIPFPGHGNFNKNIYELYRLNNKEIDYIQEYVQVNKLQRKSNG